MKPADILFSVNEYDQDGDVTERGIFLHFGTTRVLAADNFADFRTIIEHFHGMIEEIETYYPEASRDGDGEPRQ